MSETDPAQRPEEPLPKFRVNAQVFQILGLLAIALALPITILVLGLSGMRKDRLKAPVEAQITDSTFEVPGLRQSLESIAEANLPIGPVESPMRIFRLRLDEVGKHEKKRLELLDVFKRSNAGFAETGDFAMQSWLVAIGPNQERSFEEELLRMGFLGEKTGEGSKTMDYDSNSNKNLIYKICLEVSP